LRILRVKKQGFKNMEVNKNISILMLMNTKHIDIPDLLFNGVIGNVAPTREAKEAATPIL
jgi:hypothetical protein